MKIFILDYGVANPFLALILERKKLRCFLGSIMVSAWSSEANFFCFNISFQLCFQFNNICKGMRAGNQWAKVPYVNKNKQQMEGGTSQLFLPNSKNIKKKEIST